MISFNSVLFLNCIFIVEIQSYALRNKSCGFDTSPVSVVYEGIAAIETYPWMGFLYYPFGRKRFTTSIVLVTKQLALAAATEIDKLPKYDFRAKARVVLGRKCDGPNEIKVRDYTYHPEFDTNSFTALAMVQLETDHIKQDLVPICGPPPHFIDPHFFAMTLSEGCKNPKLRLHRMKYVNINRCKQYYRKSGIGQDSLWPTHTACARAISSRRCIWRSGSVLAVKQDGRWRLLGFSVYGPGCGAPARFLDYGMYHHWVRRSSATIGRPAISRLGDNHLVMRRSSSHVQRFGPCDLEETKAELYTDRVAVLFTSGNFKAHYNVTILDSIEYSCVVFKARRLINKDYDILNKTAPHGLSFVEPELPKIRLRRWCATPTAMCYGFQHLEIQFYVEIRFSSAVLFNVMAYGKEAKIISPAAAMAYANRGPKAKRPRIYRYKDILLAIKKWQSLRKQLWFYLDDVNPSPD